MSYGKLLLIRSRSYQSPSPPQYYSRSENQDASKDREEPSARTAGSGEFDTRHITYYNPVSCESISVIILIDIGFIFSDLAIVTEFSILVFVNQIRPFSRVVVNALCIGD